MVFARILRRCRAGLVSLGLALPLVGASAFAVPTAIPVPTPTVTRAPDVGTPWSAATIDIAGAGYVQEEYFIEGTARSYVPTGDWSTITNGQWDATPTGPTAPYKVRLLVERPRDPARFNGMVIVEWFNVSAMRDGGMFSNFGNWYLQQGYAYVGVSAQAAGVNHLRTYNAERYGSLVNPGDSYSYDIFSQAAQAIRGGAPLGDLTSRVRALVAWGGSQSGGRLIAYANMIHPTARVYDAIMPFVSGRSAALTQDPLPAVAAPTGAAVVIRTDIDTPIFIQNSENEALTSARGFHLQPDSAHFRLWEHAGTAHVSQRTAASLGVRSNTAAAAPAAPAATAAPAPAGLVCENPPGNGLNSAATWRAMISGMRTWLYEGRAPTSAPRMELIIPADATQPARADRDPATGITRGGIRVPDIAVPTASRWGERPPGMDENASCRLYGASDPWNGNTDPWDGGPHDISPSPEPSLRALYRNNAGYMRRFTASANDLVAHGWMLQADADALIEEARSVQIQ